MTQITADWLSEEKVQTVCRILTDAGHQAWFVGGCVRNALLGEPVADLDLATDARPDRVLALAQAAGLKAIPTGMDHGTVTVVVNGAPFETTTFRRDVATDGRRATVAFSDTMTEDARRRDFTMNALYAGPDGTVVDPLGGLTDLRARHVRFIEDADQRIKEDYLRILRFFRFYAWYGDPNEGPDADGLAACAANLDGLQSLSTERVTAEMLKLLAAPDPAPAVAAMAATGALAQLLPGADAAALAVLIHHEQAHAVPVNALRRLAVFGGNPTRLLRLSKEQERYLGYITNEMSPIETSYRFGLDAGQDKLLIEAAALGQEIDTNTLQEVKTAAEQVFPIKAEDLMPVHSGPALGQALRKAEARWIASGFTLTKADLLD